MPVDFEQLAERCNVKTSEDLFAAIGAGDVRLAHAVGLTQQQERGSRSQHAELIPRKPTVHLGSRRDEVRIEGVGNLLTQMAGCCQPVPGEPIVGYITQGRGVTIHRQDCPTVLQLSEREPERVIQVSWGSEPVKTYPVDVLIQAYDRAGLLNDILQVLFNEKVNVVALNTSTSKEDGSALIELTIEVPGLDILSRMLGRIAQLPNVMEARRKRT